MELLLSGLFLAGTLLWIRTVAQRCLTSRSKEKENKRNLQL